MENDVLKYAEIMKWERVNFTCIFEHGLRANVVEKNVSPDEINLLPITPNPSFSKKEETQIFFIGTTEANSAFFDGISTPETGGNEKVVIIMEEYKHE